MAAAWKLLTGDERGSSPPINGKSSESVKIRDPNVELAFGWNRLTLRTVGLWPHQTSEKSQSNLIVKYFSPVLAIWMSGFIIVPEVLASFVYTFVLDDLIELIVSVVGFVGVVARIGVLWYNGEGRVIFLSQDKGLTDHRTNVEDCSEKF